ncbi:MAG: hypothetical protein BWY66_00944 [bacterium ADurb.Bin374]|nr:MAG: hypothetical protein BWY66_00944 [bacterium ADurb.Bin374]
MYPLFDGIDGLFETGDLSLRKGRRRVIAYRKMCENPFQYQVRQVAGNEPGEIGCLFRLTADAAHASIDLQVNVRPLAEPAGGFIQGLQVRFFADRDRKATLDGRIHLFREAGAELEDWKPDSGTSELDALRDGGDAEPVDAYFLGHLRDFDRPVAVCVRLDGDHDLAIRANCTPDAVEIIADVIEMNACVRLIQHIRLL